MGTYCTTTTLDTLMPGVSFDTATSNIGTECIQWAEDEVNKKLAKIYDVSNFLATSTSVPPLLRSICTQLSIGYFWYNSSRGGTESLERGDKFIEKAMSNLDLIMENKIALTDTTGSLITKRSGVKGVLSTTNTYTPTFAEDSPLEWSVDTDKLDDIDSERD